MSTGQIGHRLFDLQPTGGDISLRACQWAVARAEGVLGRTLHSADLEGLGSRLSVPLLLLASTRTKKVFKWSVAQRWFVACELLERLREERGQAPYDERPYWGCLLERRLLTCEAGGVNRQMSQVRLQAPMAGGVP